MSHTITVGDKELKVLDNDEPIYSVCQNGENFYVWSELYRQPLIPFGRKAPRYFKSQILCLSFIKYLIGTRPLISSRPIGFRIGESLEVRNVDFASVVDFDYTTLS